MIPAALVTARAAYAALRTLDAEIAWLDSRTPRKGLAGERKQRVADLRRIRARRVDEIRAAVTAMWEASDGNVRRAVLRQMLGSKRQRKRSIAA